MKTSAKKLTKSAKSRVLSTLPRAYLHILHEHARSGYKCNVHNHILMGKKSWLKNIIFSWRNPILKIWNREILDFFDFSENFDILLRVYK